MDNTQIKSIGVFMSAKNGINPEYQKVSEQLGEKIAKDGFRLVYGGGKEGLMGVVALSVMEHGGSVLGVTPKNLAEEAMPKDKITELIEVPDMNLRKQLLIDESDVFIALPGGFGTLEEISQVISWDKINIIQKPIVLYDVNNFYTDFYHWLQTMEIEQFIPMGSMRYIHLSNDIDDIFNYLNNWRR